MDYDFSEEQQALRKSVRQFMRKEVPLSHVREMEEDQVGFSRCLWNNIAKLDWIGLDYPVEYGGLGGSFADVAILLEEMGRALFPSPYLATAVVAGHVLLEAARADHEASLLPQIAAGERILSLALVEASGTYDPASIETVATPDGARYVLSGTKLFVPYAHAADGLIVVARTDDGPGEESISLFMVGPRLPGVSVSALPIIGGERVSEVTLQDVAVDGQALLGRIGGGWPIVAHVLDIGKAAIAAEMVGGAQGVMDLVVKYVKERTQFGVPIGSFQAIQHRLADLTMEIEGARLLACRAAVEVAEGDAKVFPAMAKAFISEVYIRAARAAVQLHGGYGFMKEYDVQMFFRRAKACEAMFGDQYLNRELAARQLVS